LLKQKVEKIQGSKVSGTEYRHFQPLEVTASAYSEIYCKDANFAKVQGLLKKHTNAVLRAFKSKKANFREEGDLQPLSKSFLEELFAAVCPSAEVKVIGKDNTTDTLRQDYELEMVLTNKIEHITGKVDEAVFTRMLRIATWEDITVTAKLTDIDHQAQAIVELEAAANEFKKSTNKEPLKMCAILTSGVQWILFTRLYAEGNAFYRQSTCVDASNKVCSFCL
jgi:hypothetical protein